MFPIFSLETRLKSPGNVSTYTNLVNLIFSALTIKFESEFKNDYYQSNSVAKRSQKSMLFSSFGFDDFFGGEKRSNRRNGTRLVVIIFDGHGNLMHEIEYPYNIKP